MALNKSLVQTFRKNMLLVGSGWRAYFAPYNATLGSAKADTTQGPKILDLQTLGPIVDSSLPSGWYDLGWIKDYALTPQSQIGKVRSGYLGAVRALYKTSVGEEFTFKFREISKMAYKIATGSQVFNLLKNSATSTVGPLSGSGAQTVAMSSYTANTRALAVPAGSGSLFAAGDYIVCDKDYTANAGGLQGENAIPVFPNQVTDVDYIRKTSDFVARIDSISTDTLTLTTPGFIGGGSGDPTGNVVPQSGSKIQKIIGFASREGGTFVQEWSGMFVMDHQDGSQTLFYYPHIAISQFRNMSSWDLENAGATDTKGYDLESVMESMAFEDPLDGQTVVCYRAFYPATGIGRSITV